MAYRFTGYAHSLACIGYLDEARELRPPANARLASGLGPGVEAGCGSRTRPSCRCWTAHFGSEPIPIVSSPHGDAVQRHHSKRDLLAG